MLLDPGNRHSTFCVSEFDYSRFLIKVDSYSIYPLASGLLHLAQHPQGSSMQHVSEFFSFLRPNNIPLFGYTMLFIHSSMLDIWDASAFWLLCIKLLWTWGYKYLFGSLLSILLGVYPKAELLEQKVIPCLIFLKAHHTILHPRQQCTRVSSFSTSPPTLTFCFLGNSHPNGCEVVSHCGSDLHFHNY